jgi:hypothetical protein
MRYYRPTFSNSPENVLITVTSCSLLFFHVIGLGCCLFKVLLFPCELFNDDVSIGTTWRSDVKMFLPRIFSQFIRPIFDTYYVLIFITIIGKPALFELQRFLRRFCTDLSVPSKIRPSGFHFFGFRDSNFFSQSKVISLASNPPTWGDQISVFMSLRDRVAQLHPHRHRVLFSSPSTTGTATAEIFYPAPTRDCFVIYSKLR